MMNAQANPTDVWTKMMATLGAAFEEIQSDPGGGTARPASLAEYEGLYQSTWGETVILRWDDGLAALGVPSNDPVEGMTKLRHESGDTFRRIRDDGERERRTSSTGRTAPSLGTACTETSRTRSGSGG